MMATEQIKHLIKNGLPYPVIALAGSEKALIEDSLSLLREYFKKSIDSNGLNYYKFSVAEARLADVIVSLQTIPFLADKKLVEIHDCEKLNAEQAKPLIEYIKNAFSGSVLIMVFNKFDKRSKLISVLDPKKNLFVFDKLNEKNSVKIIISYAKDLGVKIDEEAASFLFLSLDGNLLAIRSTLDKLSLNHEKMAPSLSDIASVVMGEASVDVFDLARLISEGKISKALIELAKLRQQQENALKFLGVLAWQFRLLLSIRDCLDRKIPEWEIPKEVSIFGDRFNWMLQIAKKRSTSFHVKRYMLLIQCDIFLKSIKTQDSMVIIEKIVYQCSI